MSDIRHAFWANALKNSVMAVCWTVLSIVFGKWWIALFMVLCFTDFKISENTSGEEAST